MEPLSFNFNIVSYNLGAEESDYELLLSSFYPVIEDYVREKWSESGPSSKTLEASAANSRFDPPNPQSSASTPPFPCPC